MRSQEKASLFRIHRQHVDVLERVRIIHSKCRGTSHDHNCPNEDSKRPNHSKHSFEIGEDDGQLLLRRQALKSLLNLLIQ